ncbi:hypothetical protein DF3PA_80044 [Candidatus Defluviicoccus seviourii]|uniref:Uncharacterized protein n=1 Tax=Candidatus Defluviicoccus seviourii TaxID=2565273 RepID=A0A564WJR7_9PROT|nr:hypothetical protein DF3PA_80044 [Candidatus Defluviicoccus seviourii]
MKKRPPLDRSRTGMWAAMRKRQTFRPRDIAFDSGATPDAVQTYIRGLAAAGIIECIERDPPRYSIYQIVHDEGAEAPRVDIRGRRCTRGARREQVVAALRVLGGPVGAEELALVASTDAAPVSAAYAAAICRKLSAAGAVRVVEGARARRWVWMPGAAERAGL